MAAERVFPGAAPVASGRGLVASSFQYYLTGDESLRVQTISSNVPGAIVDVGVRLWREDDRAIFIERERHVCSPPALSQKDYALPAGALLNLRLSTTTSTAVYGRLFVRAQLIRGAGAAADVVGTLAQGYISPQNDRAWPGSPIESMQDSLGVVINPGWTIVAGPNLIATVPAGVRYRVVGGHFQFTAAGVGINRECFVVAADALGALVWVGANGVAVPPGTSAAFAFGAGLSPSAITSTGNSHLPWPDELDLTVGMSVQVLVAQVNPADLFATTALLVREWMDA
jgi:hypothetical protein